jgi:hypothetical protein
MISGVVTVLLHGWSRPAAILVASSGALYDALVVLHVVCAVAGFGAVAVSGVYGGLARNPANHGETARYFASRSLAEWLIVPVPFFGIAALLVDHRSAAFGRAWVIGGEAAWVVAAALLLLVIRPAERRIRENGETEQPGRLLLVGGIASNVLFAVALALMVTQPG